MKRGHGVLYGLLSLMVTFWSANFIVGKVALREFPPLLLTGLRVALAAVFMLPFYWWEGRRTNDRWSPRDVPLLAFLGLAGVGLNQLCFVVGLSRTTVGHSAILMGLTPMLVLFMGGLMRLEQLTVRKLAGMLVALGGVAILQASGKANGGRGPTWQGDLLTVMAGLTFALYTVFGKRVTERHTSITVNTFAYVSGALAVAPVAVWHAAGFPFERVSPLGWASLVYMALFPSVICYLIYYYALRRIAASRVSAFSYIQPLLATLMGVAVLGEPLTASLAVGGTVIFSGVYLTERG